MVIKNTMEKYTFYNELPDDIDDDALRGIINAEGSLLLSN